MRCGQINDITEKITIAPKSGKLHTRMHIKGNIYIRLMPIQNWYEQH